MYHYIYKVTSPSGKYYVGRHSTNSLDDGYVGSGKWVRSIKNKSILTKEILLFVDSFEVLLAEEKRHIGEYINDPLCMNFNDSPVGFATGSRNPSTSKAARERNSQRLFVDNPMWKEETRLKASQSLKGRKGKKISPEQRQKMILGRVGVKFSPEAKQNLSRIRKEQYENGRYLPTFEGRQHTDDYKECMREKMKNRPSIECEHCGGLFKPHTLKRWHGDRCKSKTWMPQEY